jgi:hypothetical protein
VFSWPFQLRKIGPNIIGEFELFRLMQETGEINAIKACFPQSTHILCIKHLKDNARENIRKTQLQPVVNTILHKIFRKIGPNIIGEFELFRLMTLVFLKQSTVKKTF